MKIFFDHQTFSLQNYGGISRYYAELIYALDSHEQSESYLSILFSENIYLKEIKKKTLPLLPNYSFPGKVSLRYMLNKAYCKYDIRQSQFDIFHPTYYDPYFLNAIHGKPFVVTFLDMIHELFSKQFPQLAADQKITNYKREVAQKATSIIAISESTKRDIVNLFDINPDKIKVIYLGSSSKFSSKELLKDTIDTKQYMPFLLFVGNRENYKNFTWFIKNVASVLIKYKLRIVCAGGGSFSKKERELFSNLRISELLEQRPINDEILSDLYRRALVFVFPSLYEGFGIPLLEAFACGCPCIVSNRSSLPEVARDAALYIDPDDPDSLTYAVDCLITDSMLRNTLIERGRQQLSNFSWGKTAQETLTLYESLVK
jgi:glycosyltransferase involved in cell wall biosynthesis